MTPLLFTLTAGDINTDLSAFSEFFFPFSAFVSQEKCQAASRQTSNLRLVQCIPTTDELSLLYAVIFMQWTSRFSVHS